MRLICALVTTRQLPCLLWCKLEHDLVMGTTVVDVVTAHPSGHVQATNSPSVKTGYIYSSTKSAVPLHQVYKIKQSAPFNNGLTTSLDNAQTLPEHGTTHIVLRETSHC